MTPDELAPEPDRIPDELLLEWQALAEDGPRDEFVRVARTATLALIAEVLALRAEASWLAGERDVARDDRDALKAENEALQEERAALVGMLEQGGPTAPSHWRGPHPLYCGEYEQHVSELVGSLQAEVERLRCPHDSMSGDGADGWVCDSCGYRKWVQPERSLQRENERLRAALQRIHDEHGRNPWHPDQTFPTEHAKDWHDGYTTALAHFSLVATEALDPEGWAEHREEWRIGVEGTDEEWWERTGNCGGCGVVASACDCDGKCGCWERHGPPLRPWRGVEDHLRNQLDAAQARIDAALALHAPHILSNGKAYCTHCAVHGAYPCATVTALHPLAGHPTWAQKHDLGCRRCDEALAEASRDPSPQETK